MRILATTISGIFFALCADAYAELEGCSRVLGPGAYVVDVTFGATRKVEIRIVETEKDVRAYLVRPRAFSIFSIGDQIRVLMTEVPYDKSRSAHADMTLAAGVLWPDQRIQQLGKGYLRISKFDSVELYSISRSRFQSLLAERYLNLAPELQFVLSTFLSKVGVKIDVAYEEILAEYGVY